MSIAAGEPESGHELLAAHLRRRAEHVERLRDLVRVAPARRLAAFRVDDATEVVKLRRAAYALLGAGDLAEPDKLIVMACAVQEVAGRPPIFSDDTAAAVWELPTVGVRSRRVEYAVPPGMRGRTPDVRRRRCALPTSYVEVGGLRVTPYERTLVDHTRHASLESAVSVCDNALHLGLTVRDALLAEWDRLPKGYRGRHMAQLAIYLADGRAESPLESLSRVRMFQVGLPKPELQVRFEDAGGFVGRTDFHWKHLGLIGECDGALKYALPEDDSDRSPVDVLLDEKAREQRLRRLPEVADVVRWGWNDALSPGRLHGILSAHGLRSVLDGGWPVPDGPLPKGAFPAERLRSMPRGSQNAV